MNCTGINADELVITDANIVTCTDIESGTDIVTIESGTDIVTISDLQEKAMNIYETGEFFPYYLIFY